MINHKETEMAMQRSKGKQLIHLALARIDNLLMFSAHEKSGTMKLELEGIKADLMDSIMNENKLTESWISQEAMTASERNPNDIEELKPKINNLVWMYAPEYIKLGDAECLAQDIMACILEGKIVNRVS